MPGKNDLEQEMFSSRCLLDSESLATSSSKRVVFAMHQHYEIVNVSTKLKHEAMSYQLSCVSECSICWL